MAPGAFTNCVWSLQETESVHHTALMFINQHIRYVVQQVFNDPQGAFVPDQIGEVCHPAVFSRYLTSRPVNTRAKQFLYQFDTDWCLTFAMCPRCAEALMSSAFLCRSICFRTRASWTMLRTTHTAAIRRMSFPSVGVQNSVTWWVWGAKTDQSSNGK